VVIVFIYKYLTKFFEKPQDQTKYYISDQKTYYPAKLHNKGATKSDYIVLQFKYEDYDNRNFGISGESIEILLKDGLNQIYAIEHNNLVKKFQNQAELSYISEIPIFSRVHEKEFFQIYINKNKTNDKYSKGKPYEILRKMAMGDEIMIRGPIGDWKYLDHPGKFYNK